MFSLGRYQAVRELGKGGMGVVYLGTDPLIGRSVAIKTIRLAEHCTPAEAGAFRERLLREAQTAGTLSHPNIVAVYDAGQQGDLDYVVMEFVNGWTLEQVIASGTPPIPEILRILTDAANALDYAHARGVIHRDVKPPNIMIREDGVVKLADFGIAKVASRQTMTEQGATVGSPEYLSPEQLRGQEVSSRSDQFSLGVVAYQLLTGHKPFEAETLPPLFMQILMQEPPAPQAVNPQLRPEVEQPLRRALSKDPAGRYGTCAEFLRALSIACGIAVSGIPAGTRAPAFRPGPSRAPRRFLRSAWFPALVMGALLVAAAAGNRIAASWQADARDWNAVKDNAYVELIEYYVQKHPLGRYTGEARGRIRALKEEAQAWQRIEGVKDAEQFRAFLTKYPRGRFALEARAKLETLELSKAIMPKKTAGPRPKTRTNFKDFEDYVWLAPGSFQMGCVPADKLCEKNEARHAVELTRGSWIAQNEVSVAAYQKFAEETKAPMPRPIPTEPEFTPQLHPMTEVTWGEAQAYCKWIGGRLPTEAEWEYAARAGEDTIGNENLATWARQRDTRGPAHQLRFIAPNAWGISDMIGNVKEWCSDRYEPDGDYYAHSPRQDPTGPVRGNWRVKRGGGAGDVNAMRFSARWYGKPEERNADTGFRCVLP